jgi:hypothetical protein
MRVEGSFLMTDLHLASPEHHWTPVAPIATVALQQREYRQLTLLHRQQQQTANEAA